MVLKLWPVLLPLHKLYTPTGDYGPEGNAFLMYFREPVELRDICLLEVNPSINQCLLLPSSSLIGLST